MANETIAKIRNAGRPYKETKSKAVVTPKKTDDKAVKKAVKADVKTDNRGTEKS